MPLEFKDISDEKSRTYTFPGGETLTLTPGKIAISAIGGHRHETADGKHVYVSPRWLYFEIGAPFRF
jgi:hypothetical protein